jgi:tRNA A37 N6-isopentenylltransferase MiaA
VSKHKKIKHNDTRRYVAGIEVCFDTGKSVTLIHNMNKKWRNVCDHLTHDKTHMKT